MLTDSHAHLTHPPLLEHLEEILARAQAAGVERIVNICTDRQSLEEGLALAKRHPWVFNTAATTPHDVEKEGEIFFPFVEEAAKKGKLVAVGETGLDYHYEHSPRALQLKYLTHYLNLAKTCALPLVFHCREAFADLFSAVDEVHKEAAAVLHCFTGSVAEAQEGVKRGWMISFSGIITFKKSEELRAVVKSVPLENMLVETDAPFLAPQSMRGKVNEPAFIRETVEVIARVKGLKAEEVQAATSQNAAKFFSFSKGLRDV